MSARHSRAVGSARCARLGSYRVLFFPRRLQVVPAPGQVLLGYELYRPAAGCCQCEGLSAAGLLSGAEADVCFRHRGRQQAFRSLFSGPSDTAMHCGLTKQWLAALGTAAPACTQLTHRASIPVHAVACRGSHSRCPCMPPTRSAILLHTPHPPPHSPPPHPPTHHPPPPLLPFCSHPARPGLLASGLVAMRYARVLRAAAAPGLWFPCARLRPAAGAGSPHAAAATAAVSAGRLPTCVRGQGAVPCCAVLCCAVPSRAVHRLSS